MNRTTVEVTATIRRHPRPVLASLGVVFGALCLYFGGAVWAAAFVLLVAYGIWKYPTRH